MKEVFSRVREDRSRGSAAGLCSVCSSHALVIEAAVRLAGRTKKPLLIEATANQVNQHGGYSGLTANAFVDFVHRLCAQNTVDPGLVLVGGDHLGPYPWRGMPAEPAMLEAERLVRHFVRAGAMRSISMRAWPSPMILVRRSIPVVPHRAPSGSVVLLRRKRVSAGTRNRCTLLEPKCPLREGKSQRSRGGLPPLLRSLTTFAKQSRCTSGSSMRQRLMTHGTGLSPWWCQPGIEFDALTVYPYRRDLATGLVSALADFPGLLFEGHSTDYQSTSALRALVEDGFAVLKVGPELTFTLRESLFGLGAIEEELLGSRDGASRLRVTVLETMREKPESWKGYYREDALLPLRMTYGYSDRVRYYWNQPRVARAVERLFANLGQAEIPLQLISQFLPHLRPAPDLPSAARTPRELVLSIIEAQLSRYIEACTPAVSRAEGGRI